MRARSGLTERPSPQMSGFPLQFNRIDSGTVGCFGGGPTLLALPRDDALVVVEEVDERPGITAQARLAMIKVGPEQLHVMNELVVERECHDVVRRLSIGSWRNRRKAQAWRCAECQRVARLDAGPTGIHERQIRNSLCGRRRCQPRGNVPC